MLKSSLGLYGSLREYSTIFTMFFSPVAVAEVCISW